MDPYLFENFNTVDGDFLTAKFRAFKFPDTTFVQFRGTVNVCVDKCKGIQCSNGQIGYGRRRREIAPSSDGNKVFEISMTTFIRVDGDPAHGNKSKLIYQSPEDVKTETIIICSNSRRTGTEIDAIEAGQSEAGTQ